MAESADGREIIAEAFRLAMLGMTGKEPRSNENTKLSQCLLKGIVQLATTGQSDPVRLASHAVSLCRGHSH
jgi:hypothetical protein